MKHEMEYIKNTRKQKLTIKNDLYVVSFANYYAHWQYIYTQTQARSHSHIECSTYLPGLVSPCQTLDLPSRALPLLCRVLGLV